MGSEKRPQRKCSGCQEMKDKKELIRVARDGENFSIDLSGKKNGRGAYICRNHGCLNKAQKSKGLERSFKHHVPKEIYDRLRTELDTLDE